MGWLASNASRYLSILCLWSPPIRTVHLDFRHAEPLESCVRVSNDDVAKLLRDRITFDDDAFSQAYCAAVRSTQRVRVRADCSTLGWEDIRQTHLKVVQTIVYNTQHQSF